MPGSEARQQLLIGLRASLPTAPGIFAWGVIAGVATVGAGLAPFTAYLMCTIIYAGSAQLAALQMLATGTPIPIIGLAALIINSRFALFSLSVAQLIPGMSLAKRVGFAYLLSDNAYGIAFVRFASRPDDPHKDSLLMGSCVAVWVSYQVGIIVGVVTGSAIPSSWSLEFAVPLTFLALGIAVIRDVPMVTAALAAGLVAVLTWHLPYRLGLALAAIAGIAAGMASDALGRRSSHDH